MPFLTDPHLASYFLPGYPAAIAAAIANANKSGSAATTVPTGSVNNHVSSFGSASETTLTETSPLTTSHPHHQYPHQPGVHPATSINLSSASSSSSSSLSSSSSSSPAASCCFWPGGANSAVSNANHPPVVGRLGSPPFGVDAAGFAGLAFSQFPSATGCLATSLASGQASSMTSASTLGRQAPAYANGPLAVCSLAGGLASFRSSRYSTDTAGPAGLLFFILLLYLLILWPNSSRHP
ncbi:unnamed protein product [Protopolystoma xenopodis]|uniref:Uncharacterized protein n=1 Tax=Protopolystoma xenopodis TaxID=117903 RepID=A0A448WDD6_9PLAT|nr:unnamed protein product [Protopolystoma xenopodis]